VCGSIKDIKIGFQICYYLNLDLPLSSIDELEVAADFSLVNQILVAE
jgi:hypothetical protein